MSSVTISPNMNLPVPTVGVDTGPDWANNLNACLDILDQHDHASGSGVPIGPSGLSISSNLTIQNNQLTNIKALLFTAQSSVTDTDSLYVKGVDLYYRDGSNNEVRMTTGGAVNATSSGITNGTASATFVGGVLVVNAAATTPANIKGGSLLLGNNSPGSNYLTLAPPNAMAASYGLVLPSLPASTKIMTLDSSGNMAGSYSVDNTTIQVATNVIGIKNLGVDTAQIAAGAVTLPKIASSSYIASTTCGVFTSVSPVAEDVTNLSVSFTVTAGRPVMIYLMPNSNGCYISNAGTLSNVYVVRDSSLLAKIQLTAGIDYVGIPPIFDDPGAGTYTYKIQVNTSNTMTMANFFLLVKNEL